MYSYMHTYSYRHTHISMYIYTGGICDVMDTFIGNGHDDTSSNSEPDYLHFT